MKKIIKQYIKQIIILIVIMAIVSILNAIFVKSSIRGDYETVTIGITKGAEAREVKKNIVEAFKKEDIKKKYEIEAVGSFGTEFRLKAKEISDDERNFIIEVLEKEYEEVHVSLLEKNPEANYDADIIMYIVYFVIVMGTGFVAIYFLDKLDFEEER